MSGLSEEQIALVHALGATESEEEAGELLEISAALEAGRHVDYTNHLGDTRLMIATVEGYYSVAKFLLEQHGADPNIGDHNGYRPLHFAEDTRILELLVKHGAEIDVLDDSGTTPLMLATRNPHLFEPLHILLRNGASPSIHDGFGMSALDYAAHYRETGRKMFDLLTAVNSAGSWKRYMREPIVQLLSLRHLCLAGRATAPPKLVRCFGAPPVPNAGKARTRRRRAAAATPLPSEVFAHILDFWNWRA